MSTVSDLEKVELLRSLALQSAAQEALQKTSKSPGLLVTLINVLCTAATFAFVAARPEPIFHMIVAGVAGAAFSLGALAFHESRRLSRRMEAALTVAHPDFATSG